MNAQSKMLEITSGVEKITPEAAQEILSRNNNNRAVTGIRVMRYAKDMGDGNFKMNGEPVIISNTNQLLDGQHRMMGVILSGISVDMMVVRGVADDAFETINIGDSRSSADILSIAGITPALARTLATTVRLDLTFNHSGVTINDRKAAVQTTPPQILKAHESNPLYLESVKFIHSFNTKNRPIPAGWLAFFHYRFKLKNDEFADDWLEKFITGCGLALDDNIHMLRDRLDRGKNKTIKTPMQIRGGWVVKSWARDIKGTTVKYNGNAFKNDDFKTSRSLITLDSDKYCKQR